MLEQKLHSLGKWGKEMALQVCFYTTFHMGEALNFQQTGYIAEGKPRKGGKETKISMIP